MGVLNRFEKGIERVVNGAFAKAFRSQVEPVELAGAVRREADDRAAVVSRGRTLTANSYVVELAQGDYDRLEPIADELRADLRQVIGDHAVEQGYSFVGPVRVDFEVASDLDTGLYRVRATTRRPDGSPAAQPQNRGGYDPPSRANPVVPEAYAQAQRSQPVPASAAAGAGAAVGATSLGRPRGSAAAAPSPAAPSPATQQPAAHHHVVDRRAALAAAPSVVIEGTAYRLSSGTTVFGRSAQAADIVIDDPGMSRRHFEITVSDAGAVASDLGSTNGTLVDGRRITSLRLTEGTVLTAGDTSVAYTEAAR